VDQETANHVKDLIAGAREYWGAIVLVGGAVLVD